MCVALAKGTTLPSAIHLALQLGFQEVIFETDSLLVYNTWKSHHGHLPYLASVLHDFTTLSSVFDSFVLFDVCSMTT